DLNLPQAHAVLAVILTFKHQHEASLAEIERAIAINPSYVDWLFGFALVYAGKQRQAIELIQAHVRLDPFYPPLALCVLGMAHYMLKQYSQALAVLRNFVSHAPNMRPAHLWLAATYAQLGQVKEARSEADEVLRLQPDYTIAGTSKKFIAFKHTRDEEHFLDGMRKAGLPE